MSIGLILFSLIVMLLLVIKLEFRKKRMSRKKFIVRHLLSSTLMILLGWCYSALGQNNLLTLLCAFILVILGVYVLALIIYRLHDIDYSGYLTLLLIPKMVLDIFFIETGMVFPQMVLSLIFLIFLIFLYLKNGTAGTNKYGIDISKIDSCKMKPEVIHK
ncbi:DUF805 domain-containing protein [Fusibacter sp. 3D3]|uniref:DUF805 domain-containing protein n=1 Tax=Fusibacter sp. 3D3 TaxID=1048380 RepID=UPI000852D64D|nr:DUF805 domain-containing protein [Fusibacter sp. 3D3]